MWWGKWGCRAASPLAAVAVCGSGKVPGRDKSLPYGLNHKRDLAVSCGPGMPGPYRAIRSLSPRGFGGTPEFKVEEGSAALRTDSNTASV